MAGHQKDAKISMAVFATIPGNGERVGQLRDFSMRARPRQCNVVSQNVKIEIVCGKESPQLRTVFVDA